MKRPLVAALVAAAVTAVGGLPRVLLASGRLPEWLAPFVWSDPLFVYERGLSGQRIPYVDAPFEYPPLIGGISGLLSVFAPGPVGFVVGWLVVVAVAAGATGAMLATVDRSRTWWSWSLAPQLLLLGAVNFDALPVALATAAAIAIRRRHGVRASVLLALGTVAKLFPGASAPLAIAAARRRVPAILAFLAVLALAYLPTFTMPFSSAGGLGFYAVGIRSNLDSVWGILERVLSGIGVPGAGAVVLVLTLGGTAVAYLFFVVPRALRASDPVVGFCLATLTLLLWARVYSPQYSLWVLPFFALLGLPARLFVVLCVADVGVFLTVYPLSLVERPAGDTVAAVLLGLLAGSVVLRHLALWAVWRAVLDRGAELRGSPRGDGGQQQGGRERDGHAA